MQGCTAAAAAVNNGVCPGATELLTLAELQPTQPLAQQEWLRQGEELARGQVKALQALHRELCCSQTRPAALLHAQIFTFHTHTCIHIHTYCAE